jgi:MraZ protein
VGVSGQKWEIVERRHQMPGVHLIKRQIELMFLGRYEHSIDEKGRITIPVRYRELLVNGAYVCQGFEKNLMVLTTPAFQQFTERVNQISMTDPFARQLMRLIFSSAERCEFDRVGRLLLPQFLRGTAQLDNSAVLVGMGNFFEIWSPQLFAQKELELNDPEVTAQRFAAFDLSIR